MVEWKRKRSGTVRPVSGSGLSVPQTDMTRAGWIWLKPCWMASRCTASVSPEAHTWLVRASMPRSVRTAGPGGQRSAVSSRLSTWRNSATVASCSGVKRCRAASVPRARGLKYWRASARAPAL